MTGNCGKIKKNGSKSLIRRKRRQRLRQESKTVEKSKKHEFRQGKMGCQRTDIWYDTYQKMVKWHSEHQMNYWRMRAHQLQLENDQLKRSQQMTLHNAEPDSPSDDEDCSDTDFEPIDEEYLKFMEITLNHRDELRKKREMENVINENDVKV